MQESLNELDLLSKKSKLNKTETNKVVSLMSDVYQKDGDMDRLCLQLLTFPVGVSELFFINNYSDFSNTDVLKWLVDTLINNDIFQKNTRDTSVRRVIEIINIYLKNNNFDNNICILFNNTLKVAFKKYVVSDAFITLFQKKIIQNSNLSFLKLNVVNDETIYVFLLIDKLIEKNHLDVNSSELKNWAIYDEYITKEHLEIIKKIQPKKSKSSSTTQNELASSISELQSKINKMEENEYKMLSILENLQSKFDGLSTNSNNNINSNSSSSNDNSINSNTQEINSLKEQLAQEKEKNANLDKRLTTAYAIDQSSNNQEVVALKNDIIEGLKFEHKNYKDNLDEQCTEDNFMAYRATIMRIFRTLRRLGVEFE